MDSDCNVIFEVSSYKLLDVYVFDAAAAALISFGIFIRWNLCLLKNLNIESVLDFRKSLIKSNRLSCSQNNWHFGTVAFVQRLAYVSVEINLFILAQNRL